MSLSDRNAFNYIKVLSRISLCEMHRLIRDDTFVQKVSKMWIVVGVLSVAMVTEAVELTPDPKGYIMYCPCMGRFGNQADHFLGSLGFAKALDRTLVLPPWVEYHINHRDSVQVPFDEYFKVEPLQQYHRVITMEKFMKKLAPTIWPEGERIVFCYTARTHGPKKNDCNAKNGNPFGPFWDTFKINFDKSEFYGPLYHDVTNLHEIQRWKEKYDPETFPVLAFTGAPAQFPVQKQHVALQKYIIWSNNIVKQRDEFIKEKIGDEKYVGIHLRLGTDFEGACKHLKDSPLMFGAAQCLGFRGEKGSPTQEMCYQSDKTIIRDLKSILRKTGYKVVFVATDSKDLISKLMKKFKDVSFVKHEPSNPHIDLSLLAKSDYFIGNCISTFTAFVKRERDVNKLPTKFWDFPPPKTKSHDEL